MIPIAAALIYFPATVSWIISHIAPALSYFPATMALNMTPILAALMMHVVAVLSYSQLNPDTHQSCSEPLPRHSELKHDTHCSCSELLTNSAELKNDTHPSCSELLLIYTEMKQNIVAALSFFIAAVSWNIPLSYFPATLNRNTISNMFLLSTETWRSF